MEYGTEPALAVSEPRMRLVAERLAEGYSRKTGIPNPPVHIGYSSRAWDNKAFGWYIMLGDAATRLYFQSDTLVEVVALAEAWTLKNDVGDINETLGLTRDGRFIPEDRVVEPVAP